MQPKTWLSLAAAVMTFVLAVAKEPAPVLGEIEPAVAAADKASQFDRVMARKNYSANDVEAGRAFVASYVEYVHHAERLYNAAETAAPEHKH